MKFLRYSLSLLVCLFTLSSPAFAQNSKDVSFEMSKWIQLQNAVLRELDRSYVDSLPVDRMYKAAIAAMLAELDPYTEFVPEEDDEDFQMRVAKVYGGIGAIVYKPDVDGDLFINEPYENSPSARAGLRCADRIVKIDGISTKGLTTAQCTEKMKGAPGTVLNLTVKKAFADTVELQIVRERIHLPDIEYAGMLDSHTGYILQTGFTEGVAQQLRSAIVSLREQGMTKLVYDLRGNGGGLMQEAIDIVSIFLPKGSVAVSQKGKDPKDERVYRTRFEPVDTRMPVIVMVDGGSASASEIVAGALQDHGRATLMGKRTFGKGLVQSVRPLPYGCSMKVTTAKYYTPSGRCVQALDYSNRGADGAATQIPGGGITPDVEIPVPQYDDAVYSIIMKGYLEQYVMDYASKHQSIDRDFHFTEFEDFQNFIAERISYKEPVKEEQIAHFIEEELVARYFFRKASIEVRLRYDTQLKTALQSPLK